MTYWSHLKENTVRNKDKFIVKQHYLLQTYCTMFYLLLIIAPIIIIIIIIIIVAYKTLG
jgi:hypothetical protein